MTDFLERKIDIDRPGLASVLDEVSLWSARFGVFLLEHVPLAPGLRVLDVGCGTGFPLFELAHSLGDSCRLTGIDTWPGGLARAAFKLETYERANVSLARADGACLPFRPAEFDLIVCNVGINNFAEPRAVLVECARVARPEAVIAISTNVKGHMRELYQVYRATLSDLGLADRLPELAENEDHRLTKETISLMLSDAGFAVARGIEREFQMRFTDGSTFLRHWLVVVGFLPGWRGAVEPTDEERVFSTIERKLNDVARREGELRMTIPMLYLEGRRRSTVSGGTR